MENSLIHPDLTFALWAIFLSAATIGVWGEKNSWGAKISGAVITMLLGFFYLILGTILAYYLLPLGEEAGKLAGVFCATYIVGLVSFFLYGKNLGVRFRFRRFIGSSYSSR